MWGKTRSDTKYHAASQGITKYHRVSQAITEFHRVSQGITANGQRSTVARRPYLATSQASRVLGFDSGEFSAGKAIKLPKSCCKELSLATSCLRSSTENDFRTRFLLVIIKRTFLELAWRRPEHLIVSEAPNNKTANCFHELFCLNKVSH